MGAASHLAGTAALFLWLLSSHVDSYSPANLIQCYDNNYPQRCVPEFGNIAYNMPVDATNTCGVNGRTDFCTQTETSKKSCGSCYAPDNPDGHPSYPPRHITDHNNEFNITWWQSDTMNEEIQYPNQVNLTINLQKAYDVTYVQVTFYSPRPESFAIYKRTTKDSPWIPWQYYSLTCRDTYGLQEMIIGPLGDQTRALCNSEYSDMTPLTGGTVAFSTLEGSPKRHEFDETPDLWEWVTATEIRITLDRLNTFGDELWQDPHVLKSYFYAVTDLAIGARCKCNGHASECPVVGPGLRRVCRCKHNTDGEDCQRCLPFYNDVPWKRASKENAYECKACNCNGFSNRCMFDDELFRRTGHGGHCLDCQGNRAGPNCERCRDNFFQLDGNYCVDCNCNDLGSRTKQCSADGKCLCKSGVGGDKCDRCLPNFYDFGVDGCKPCGCSVAGSLNNKPHCNPVSGVCNCKEHVEGRQCHECKPGFFNLDQENDYGCTPCFCYGHASVCGSAPGYSRVVTESSFARGNEKWAAEDSEERLVPINYNAVTQTVSVTQPEGLPVYFAAPARFLGDQRASYNQDLEFKLRIGETSPVPAKDVIIEGAALVISQPIFGQNNPIPTVQNQEYRFRLHEHSDHGWQPRLTARDFMSVLSNITAIKVRGTYLPRGVGFLDDFRLHTARRGAAGANANWIEMCTCPTGYVGQFCESCAHKYRHEPANGGPFARCVPCNCNKHADSCEEDSGRCICQHNTEGENCERCARGFYGNSLEGTPDDCKPCPCPEGGPCIELDNNDVVCLECPKGYSGHRCDLCSDGYFGDPLGKLGPVTACLPCECNNNVDLNAVGNCNRTTGECLKCIYNTGGAQCDQCLPGFFGDALSLPKGDCKPCQCYRAGTQQTDLGPPMCDQLSGRCHCKAHVQGANCDECQPGYFNILSGEGCETCNCDPVGSLNHTCEVSSGQCFCREGVTGTRCNQCEPYYYGFSTDGCKPCHCDDIGSTGYQCDANGQCPCRENVEGRTCDRCKENKFDRQQGCVDCPACYSLVQDAANLYRDDLAKLRSVLDEISSNPTVIDDADFEFKLKEVQDRVNALVNDARYGSGGKVDGEKSISEQLKILHERLEQVADELKRADDLRSSADGSVIYGASNITLAEEVMANARQIIAHALEYLRTEGTDALLKALNRSEQFGQQNKHISEISQDARHLASEHQKEAERIKEISLEAEKISEEAFSILRDANTKNRNTTDKLLQLRSDVTDLERKVANTKALAQQAQNSANQTLNEALQVYQEMTGLQVADTPAAAARQKEEAGRLSAEAQRVAGEASVLYASHADAWQELKNLLGQSEKLLLRGEEQQMRANKLLADVDVAKKMAEDAVKLGQSTINEAQETLTLLSGFEKNVQDSKDRALQAMQTLPEIQELISDAQKKASQAREALHGAELNAQKARDTAQEAQTSYAERASKEAHEIRKEAEDTKSKAGTLRDETDALAHRVAVTTSKLTELEAQAASDGELTREAKKKVGQAKLSVSDAAKQVQKAMDDVGSILRELEGLPDIDEGALAELEARLDEAERMVQESGMDERMQQLKDEKFSQTQLVNHYQTEVAKLEEEVANIKKISDSLPLGCFKTKTTLEP